ncbi:Serine/threonine-protein kinase mos [Nymphon striatum]|nr:Serine/threonine-protein kinase mos [Nymphon striatum]
MFVFSFLGKKRAMKIAKRVKPTMFTREAWALHLDHPNIIKTVDVHDTCDDSDFIIIVMEFVGDETLQTYLDRQNFLTLKECVKFATQISDALVYCHGKNIIHLDLKPSNIVLTPSSVCKLADFGCCINTNETQENDLNDCLVVGTVPYTAPEIFKGSFPTFKADIYSLSIVMWQLWNNQTPYSEIQASETVIYKVVAEGKRPDILRKPKTPPEHKYLNMYQQGWKTAIDYRPSSQEMFVFCCQILTV